MRRRTPKLQGECPRGGIKKNPLTVSMVETRGIRQPFLTRSVIVPRDFTVENHGTICLVQPLTPAAARWIDENVAGDATFWCGALVVEPRYLWNLVFGMNDAGLSSV
jgi:hypothetical protein